MGKDDLYIYLVSFECGADQQQFSPVLTSTILWQNRMQKDILTH